MLSAREGLPDHACPNISPGCFAHTDMFRKLRRRCRRGRGQSRQPCTAEALQGGALNIQGQEVAGRPNRRRIRAPLGWDHGLGSFRSEATPSLYAALRAGPGAVWRRFDSFAGSPEYFLAPAAMVGP